MFQLTLFDHSTIPPVQYWPAFLQHPQADLLLKQSLTLDWQQHSFPCFGNLTPLPRLETMVGDSEAYVYIYSGAVELKAQLWPPFLLELRSQLEAATGYLYQVAMGNLYRNGQDSMGYHADDEPTLGHQPAIASISLGATRTFRLKRKQASGKSQAYELSHGDLLLMLPGCQEEWVHALPKTRKQSGIRVNWTFRPYVMMGS